MTHSVETYTHTEYRLTDEPEPIRSDIRLRRDAVDEFVKIDRQVRILDRHTKS